MTKVLGGSLINGKFYCPPVKSDRDLKKVITDLFAAGVGNEVDEDNHPKPWTPEQLTIAISQIEQNSRGIELRTVQLWFQDNDRAISNENLRWLARVFGCQDPEASHLWYLELREASKRLKENRKNRKVITLYDQSENPIGTHTEQREMSDKDLVSVSLSAYTMKSKLDLPALVFMGSAVLVFLAYAANIHSVSFDHELTSNKQVGFLWAPNWTILFMVLLPLFFLLVADLVDFWITEGRQYFQQDLRSSWKETVYLSRWTFWAIFIGCLPMAGLTQWLATRYTPLARGEIGSYAMDWGTVAIARPEVISIAKATIFTGACYIYMCICFYIFFVGLILLMTIVTDLCTILRNEKLANRVVADADANSPEIGRKIMIGVFRCTVVGLLITILMKLQGFYLISENKTIISWILQDLNATLLRSRPIDYQSGRALPQFFSSLLIVPALAFVFLYGYIQLKQFCHPAMMAVFLFLIAVYTTAGSTPGFSIVLFFGLIVATYSLFRPTFSRA